MSHWRQILTLASQQFEPRKGLGEGFTGVDHGRRWGWPTRHMANEDASILLGFQFFTRFKTVLLETDGDITVCDIEVIQDESHN